MTEIQKVKVVPYSVDQMYALVNDVGAYQEFIPCCVSSSVLSETPAALSATLTFARGGMQKSFTTRNLLQPGKVIEMRLVDGPFKALEGYWRFDALEGGRSQVALDLKFEFSSRMIGMMFGSIFHQVASRLVDSFSERALAVYGEGA